MTARKPSVLAVDDDDVVVDAICAIGRRAGFEAVSSTSSADLAALVEKVAPDVIVLDLQMPDTDGVGALRYLADKNVAANIILVTGMDQRTLVAAEQYGVRRGLHVSAAFQKPFDPEELFAQFERIYRTLQPICADDLHLALQNDELVVHYQPIIQRFADDTWDVCAVEALLRWQHPARGFIAPESFLAIAEGHGLSRALTDFVLQRGIEQMKGWLAQQFRVGLRVNIAATLINDLEFPDRLEAMLVEQGVEPGALALELTETAMLEQTTETFDILTRLRIKNVNLAIDDFGIGHSSLTQLLRMPFNEIKIDKSLVGQITGSKEAEIMVDALISLAHKLGLTACAEGVEDAASLGMLEKFRCDYVQGYYVSPPVPAREVPKVVAQWNSQQELRALGRRATS